MNCAICDKPILEHQLSTVRETWLINGGFGSVPDSAIVHLLCDNAEIRRLKLDRVPADDLNGRGLRRPA